MSSKNFGSDKYVLVTGAFGGLGRALCSRLSTRGYTVFACDIAPRDPGDAHIIPVRLDVTDPDSIAACADAVRAVTDTLYAVINLAGVFRMTSAAESDVSGLEAAIDVNLLGTYRVNHAMLPLLRGGYSRIINMSSEVGYYSPAPFNAAYAVSKHAVDAYSDVLRRELMFVRIPVCKIRAGSFSTQMLSAAQSQYDALVRDTELFRRELTTLAPIMTAELASGNPPEVFARMVDRQLRRRRPRRCVRIRNSVKLSLLNALPEGMQDIAYRAAMKIFALFE